MAKLLSYSKQESSVFKESFLFPKHWEIEAAHFAFDEVRDGTHDSPKPVESGIRLITSKNLKSGYIDFSEATLISELDHQEIKKRSEVKNGDLLFSMIGTIGNIAIVNSDMNFSIKNIGLFRSRPLSLIPRFSMYWLMTNTFQKYLDNLKRGGNQKFVSLGILRASPIPLPPLAEQKEISTLLDNLLAQVDTLKTRLDAIPNILKRFRQSVLAAAVSGKLTEEWRVNKIHKTIEVRKISDELFEIGLTHGNFGKKLDRAPTIESDELKSVVKHINNWSLVRIGEICKCIVPNRDKPQTFSGGYHWLLTHHFHEDSININYKNIEKGLSNEEIIKYKAKVIEEKSIIMTCIGRVGLSAVLKEKAVINQQSHAFIPNDYVIPEYIAYCIRANKTYFEEKATSTTVSYLNKTACNSLPIPLASIEEQKEIVRRVEELFAFADQIEQRVKSAQQRVNHLTQAILAKAFRGELTAEWREQNPDLISGENSAAALLARIQAERKK